MPSVPTSEDLVSFFHQGKLAIELSCQFGLNDQNDIQTVVARCAELHNAGTIDLIRLIESIALQELEGTDFFMATDFFCRILPELEAMPARVMACVQALVTRGGEDIMANQPNAAFRAWCTKDPSRAHAVIDAALAGDDLACRHLTFALEAVMAIPQAREIALAHDDSRRLSAVTALCRIKDDDTTSRAETLTVFNTLINSRANDTLRANILQATASLISQDLNPHLPEAVELVRRLVENAGEVTIHQSAHILWAFRGALNLEIIDVLLEALSHVKPANKGTLSELDRGLRSLLELGYDEAAIAYVAKLLSRQEDGLKLEEFNSFTNTLLSGPPERVSRVIVQWLLLGNPRLCDGLANVIRGRGMDGPPLDLRAEDLAISPSAQVFICRKAIGWFFFKPTTASSVLVSVLRICNEETALEVQKLLVETLLLNYNGVRTYLNSLAPDDAAKKLVDKCLEENDAYLEALRGVPLIKELQPSEHHRRIERLRMSDQMRDVTKQAQSKSVFLKFARHSVLLYGNRSISFVRVGKDALRPVEMDLKPFGISYEMPRMQIIDPVGLDLTLRIFRTERINS